MTTKQIENKLKELEKKVELLERINDLEKRVKRLEEQKTPSNSWMPFYNQWKTGLGTDGTTVDITFPYFL